MGFTDFLWISFFITISLWIGKISVFLLGAYSMSISLKAPSFFWFCEDLFIFFRASYFLASISSLSSSLLILTLIEFLLALGSIISLAACYYFDKGVSPAFFNSLTRSAYRRVFIVFSADVTLGDTLPIITVLQNPTKESLRTMVSLLPRKGVWPFPWSRALIHYFNANKDLLI